MSEDLSLSILGSNVAQPTNPDDATLETIPNRWPNSNYVVNLYCEEFTCICPITGQPDFGKIVISYVPKEKLVESKALKLYLGSYRNQGIFHEFVVNKICNDLKEVLHPKKLEVKGEFRPRGGIAIVPIASYNEED
jgi:7-cyano-7-deazaguanine reductase